MKRNLLLAGPLSLLLLLTACLPSPSGGGTGARPTPTAVSRPTTSAPQASPPTAPAQTLASQYNDQGAVSIEVVPVGPIVAGQPLAFEVALNTHSVDLSYDMVKVTVLRDDQGREYPATGWEGSPSGGYHRSGTIHFAPLETLPRSIAVVIKGIAGVPERVFRWELLR